VAPIAWSPHGPCLHDGAATPKVLHGSRGCLGAEEFTFEDHFKAVIFNPIDLQKRLRRKDAGVVEQHVETTELIGRRFHDGFAGGRQGDIANMHEGTLAFRVDFARGRLGLGTIAAIDDN
jgi:hypothetical protein